MVNFMSAAGQVTRGLQAIVDISNNKNYIILELQCAFQ